MSVPKVNHVSASVVRGGGGDYHDVEDGHWIHDHVSTPMARYPEYRQSRLSFGINVLGTLVVEVEADDGTTGFAITTAGEPGAFIVEKHLARFAEGRPITDIERAWTRSTVPLRIESGHRTESVEIRMWLSRLAPRLAPNLCLVRSSRCAPRSS
jgi:hypothetical protein